MVWTFFYGGKFFMGNLSETDMASIQKQILHEVKNGGGWVSLTVPSEDGIVPCKFFASAGVAMAFYPDTDNSDLVQSVRDSSPFA
jgi:uncharacterized protein YodC (DUF2158 family)